MYYITADIATTPTSVQLLQGAEASGTISQAPYTAAVPQQRGRGHGLVEPRGHATTHRFDGSGALIETAAALGQTTTYERTWRVTSSRHWNA
jgi:YD repeat-containing protein